ncbi:Rrf2 family transcriptional regulator [Geovibrio thiophilus]|uniref:Rrf2 family transcriptional regulator n=1 Tax=Geovibrio thiophilus TaxID=139438 RepID=A0A410JWR4_9BACT|nr:Rrf2 family transcriptional regulator [Geovibrio thiophilus]QAR32471.1 Rrf2 family transcriptional regulator [Geovibrio thiophilus]
MDSFIAREGDYAIRIVVYLAENGGMKKVEEISAAIGVPKPTTAKVINRLKKSGLITTRTGKNGGIEAAPSALDSSLYDILKCMGVTLDINVCVAHPSACSRKPFCRVTHRLAEIQSVMTEQLMNSKVKDFIF